VSRRAPAGKVNRSTRAKAYARSAPARQPDVLPTPDRWLWLVWPGLLAATALAYFPVWHGGMLWDDEGHITPPDLRSLAGLWRIWFVIGATQQYYPLTHSVFWVLHRLIGDDTLGYHLVNIGLHATSAFLFVLILRRLAVPGAVLAGAIFALHPVEVESVAWMTELKNILSGVCGLAALLAYLEFDRSRRRVPYVVASALFVMSLLSKSVTATLPAVILVIVWWVRGRLRWREDVVPLVPWFGLGAAGGLMTAWVERTQIGARGAPFEFTTVGRSLIAGRAIWFYLAKLVWPSNLIFNYPRWNIDEAVVSQYLYPLALAALAISLWAWRQRSRAPLAALLIFCGALFPALGFVNVYPFVFSFVADHFQYLAGLSVFALLASGTMRLLERRGLTGPGGEAAAVLLVAAPLALLTWRQSGEYVSSEALYRATLARNPASWLAHNNLGSALGRHGQLGDAMAHFTEALRLAPDYVDARINLGAALQRRGRLDDAIAQYREALRIAPTDPNVHVNLGDSLIKIQRPEEAIAEYSKAEALLSAGHFAPENQAGLDRRLSEAHLDLGIARANAGAIDRAVLEFREAVRLNPGSASAQNNLGSALFHTNRAEEALEHLMEAVRLQPDDPAAQSNLGDALLMLGRDREAVDALTKALELPFGRGSPEEQNDLGVALGRLGRLDAAVPHFEEALRLKPDFADARVNLARVQAALHGRR
jgi:Flp pilus assembly protein TadD